MKNKIVLDSRINKKSVDLLIKLGFEPVFVPECRCLDNPVSAHPDMSLIKIDNYLFVANDIAHMFGGEKTVVCNREERLLNYPEDVMFNCAVVGKNVLCKEGYVHSNIKDFLINNNYNIVNVKQGYAKCSTCVVSDNAVITEDDNIEQVAKSAGIDVLKLDKGFVNLNGYDYGFIGGASGLLNKNLLCFNGKIENHPQYKEIRNFCKNYGVEIVSLNNEPLYDVGSIIVF